MIISASENDFEAAPAGVHVACLFRITDLGTQIGDYQGKPTKSRKLMFTWELLGDERMKDGKPFVISRRLTASLSEKAALRAMIGQWRGKALTDDEVKAGFDVKKLLGAYCLLNVTETERDGKTYMNIASVMPLPKGMPQPPGVNPLQLFDLAAPDWNIFDTLSKRTQDAIAASPEYQAAQGWGQPEHAPTTPANAEAFGDDLPF